MGGAGDELKLRANNRPIDDVEGDNAAWSLRAGLLTAGAAASATAGAHYFLALRNDQRLDDRTLRSATQEELNAITDTSLAFVVGAGVIGAVGVAALGAGTGALVLNPARAELDAALE